MSTQTKRAALATSREHFLAKTAGKQTRETLVGPHDSDDESMNRTTVGRHDSDDESMDNRTLVCRARLYSAIELIICQSRLHQSDISASNRERKGREAFTRILTRAVFSTLTMNL